MDELNRILYVEDEPDIQAVAKMALEAVGGFEVEICSSGPEAIAAAPGFEPQLVLLDVMMAGMDGLTTYALLQELSSMKGVPVIFMTARVQQHEVTQYYELGAIDVVVKPFDPMALSDLIRAAWKRHHDG